MVHPQFFLLKRAQISHQERSVKQQGEWKLSWYSSRNERKIPPSQKLKPYAKVQKGENNTKNTSGTIKDKYEKNFKIEVEIKLTDIDWKHHTENQRHWRQNLNKENRRNVQRYKEHVLKNVISLETKNIKERYFLGKEKMMSMTNATQVPAKLLDFKDEISDIPTHQLLMGGIQRNLA